MTFQDWFCESCFKRGTISYKDSFGVYEIVNEIRKSHKINSPECESGIEKIKIYGDPYLDYDKIEDRLDDGIR